MTLGRERLQIVEMDIDYCTQVYNTAPCTAKLGSTGTRKCFNSYATCQDRTNYTAGTLTLRFAENQSGLPKGQTIFPCLAREVSTNAASVNLGGMDDKRGPLGKRARITVNLKDFPYHDTYTDKYAVERRTGAADSAGAYNPEDRGTFFSKLRTRFPYYQGRALRVKEGYVGEDLADMRTRNFVVTEWSGPDANGNVTITAKDVLDLADNEKAKAPTVSQGRIANAIEAETLAEIQLTPEKVGDEYPASGRALIGSEIVTYTRSGDTVTITGRGVDGTTSASHDIGDTFQECLRFENAPIQEIIRDLLRDYAGVSSDFIPYQEWTAEAERWMAGFNLTTTIPKPTGVTTLVGELLELGVHLWWDDEAQQIGFRAHRPLDVDEEAATITDDLSIVAGSLQVSDLYDQRISQVHLYDGVLDFSKSVTDSENFRRVSVAADLASEGDNEYGETRIKEIYSRWLGVGSDSIVDTITGRRLNRYRDTPRQVSFALDIKDKASVSLAGLARITSRVLQDDTGATTPTQMQFSEVAEKTGAHMLMVKAETFNFDQRIGFIMPSDAPSYNNASDEEKTTGWFFIDEGRGEFGDGSAPYIIY